MNALHRPLAIVGMACCLPGANNVEEFWSLLKESRCAIGPLPADRFDRELYFNPAKGVLGQSYTDIGGVIEETPFDPELFTPEDVARHDPSHLRFCQVAHRAWSGVTGSLRKVGVYVGEAAGSELGSELDLNWLADSIFAPLSDCPKFAQLPEAVREQLLSRAASVLRKDYPARDAEASPFTGAGCVAALTAEKLALEGPRLAVDAACASSLVAFAVAAAALQSGSIEAAIVGGASHLKSDSLVLFSRAQSCSAAGSRPFDDEADGLVSSEGYVAFAIKTLDRALQEGDEVLAVVRGLGLSSDGRGRSLWAPRVEGQATAMRRAYGPGVEPSSIQYVEAHATSTRVGDATELVSLRSFFEPHISHRKVPLGSVKSNIGHTLETAGLASLLKVVLALRHRWIPATLGVRTPNKEYDWAKGPFQLAQQATPWPEPERGVPRRGAVSAFGIGGLNMHVVVEEPSPGKAADWVPVSREPIAVVGRGVLLPGAFDIGQFARFADSKENALCGPPAHAWHEEPGRLAGFVNGYEFDWLRFKLPPKQIEKMNPLQLSLLDASEQALGPLNSETVASGREVAVVVGSPFGGDFARRLLLGLRLPVFRRTIARCCAELEVSDTVVAELLEQYESRMRSLYPAFLDETGGFTASTLASRITKTFNLTGGALAVDADENSSAAALELACNFLHTHTCREVLCAGAQSDLDGLAFEVLGRLGGLESPPAEGVAVLLLKKLADARADGDTIFGVIQGLESGLHSGASCGESDGVGEVVDCNVFAMKDTRRTRGSAIPDPLFPRMGCLRGAHLLVSVLRKTLKNDGSLTRFRSSSPHGFTYDVTVGPAEPLLAEARVLRLAAPDKDALREKLAVSSAGRLWSAPQRDFAASDGYRLAVVAPDQESLAGKLRLVRAQLDSKGAPSRLENQGVFLRRLPPTAPKIAFVFPGQGSQYKSMLLPLMASSDAARETIENANAVLRELSLPDYQSMVSVDDESLDQDPVITQMAVLVADMTVYSVLRERGLRPDCVCGHSFGEIPAMVAAGVWSLAQALRFTMLRARALSQTGGTGGLLSTQAVPEVLQALLDAHGLDLYFTHYNAPQQTVLGGSLSELDRCRAILKSEGVPFRRLKVPGPLHTPLLDSTAPPLQEYLKDQTLFPPRTLLASNVTGDYAVRPLELKRNLVSQLTRPVLYQAMIERLVEDGFEVLIEVGPGRVLTGLHRQIMGERVVALSSDAPRLVPTEQLLRLQAGLECLGVWPTVHGGPARHPAGQVWPVEDFDATASRRQRRRGEAANRASVQAPVAVNHELQTFLVDYLVELTGYPAEVIDLDWDLEADLGVDSIKLAQLFGEVREAFGLAIDETAPVQQLRTLNQILAWAESRRESSSESEMQRYLTDYVVELTGYPAEVIDLDWDLEADLGIDSIKLAQLFGELRENYAFESLDGDINLAEFRSLRQILKALEGSTRSTRSAEPVLTGPNGAPQGTSTETARITSRYLMRLVDAPHREGSPTEPKLYGACLVIGSNELADCLGRQLSRSAVRVFTLQPRESPEETVAEFEELWLRERIHHLFLVTPHDQDAETSLCEHHWQTRRARGLLSIYWLCQAWYKKVGAVRDMWEQISLVALTNLGGSFGFEGKVVSAESGALAGLLKALVIESWVGGHRSVPIKIIDTPPGETPEEVAAATLRELAVSSYDMEIAYGGGRRRVVRAYPEALDEKASARRPEGTWIATGGGRGITAEAVRELGLKYGLKFHLLARSPLPEISDSWRRMWPESARRLKFEVMAKARAEGQLSPVNEWLKLEKALELEATLKRLHSLGVEATYHCCDVADREAVARTLSRIRELDGPIRGVLHGAGYSRDTKYENKDPRRVEQCIQAKVDGTLALMDLTQGDPLTHFITFGSISGRFGANGHTDYSLSNDMMAKLVDWYRAERPDVAAVNFHWHAWGDVGMAMRADTQLGLEKIGMKFMPAREGLEHLVREIEAGAPSGEVLITDDHYYRLFFHSETMKDGLGKSTLSLLHDAELVEIEGQRVFTVVLDPVQDPFLVEHRLDDRPILPLVVAMEAMAEAALDTASFSSFGFEDVETHQALRFFVDAAKPVRVLVREDVAGRVVCELRSDFHARDGTLVEPNRLHFRATVVSSQESSALESRRVGEVNGAWKPVDYPPRSSKWFHGPPLQNLRQMTVLGKEAWGCLTAPAQVHLAGPLRAKGTWVVPAAAIDACLYAAGCFGWADLGMGSTVPAGISSLKLGRLPQPGEACRVRVELVSRTQDQAEFDFELFGQDGNCLLRAQGYRLASLRSPMVKA